MNVKLAEQRERALDTFRRVERIEAVAATVPDAAADELYDVVDEMLEEMPPVRVGVAAEILGLTKPTVSKWRERGVLKPATDTPVQTLDPHRLRDVLRIVKELRAASEQPGNLVDEVWYRLQDQVLLESDDVRAGLAAWKSGNVQDA
ncbi:hypothetical protein ACTG9Q_09700 [Actinokineospora sp. 24-640]